MTVTVGEARALAEATLAGQVNDWAAVAKRHAAHVLELCDSPEAVRVREQLTGLAFACTNLSDRIVEKSDNRFEFAYGSRGVVEAFRQQLGEVNV